MVLLWTYSCGFEDASCDAVANNKFFPAVSWNPHAATEATENKPNQVTTLETVRGGRGTGRLGTSKWTTNRL